MLTPWALKKLQHLTLDYMEITCDGKACHGWVAVHRINFGLGLFHLVLALFLLGPSEWILGPKDHPMDRLRGRVLLHPAVVLFRLWPLHRLYLRYAFLVAWSYPPG